jgi:hypothetical protein
LPQDSIFDPAVKLQDCGGHHTQHK